MKNLFLHKKFLDANQEYVPYDGSEVTWRVSVYAIVEKKGKILIIKNKKEKLHDVVGGGVELGESIEEALFREALEEGGAKIHLGKLLEAHVDWFYHRSNQQYHQTLQLFYAAQLDGELQQPTDKDTEWYGFVAASEIGKSYRLPPIVEKVVRENFQQ